MTRWEYVIDGYGTWTDPHLSDILAERGADGWEMIAINWDERQVIFKRPAGDVR